MTEQITRGNVDVVREEEFEGDDDMIHTANIEYRQRDDGGWDVRTPETDWFGFARPSARERDVTQLIFKKWCRRFGDPDPLDDRD